MILRETILEMPLRNRALILHLWAILDVFISVLLTCLWWLIGVPLLLPFLVTVFALSVVVYFYRSLFTCVVKGTTTTRLSAEESALLEKVGSDAVIQCLINLNAPVDLMRLRERIQTKVIDLSTSFSERNIFSRFTQRIVLTDDEPHWRIFDQIEVSNHVHEISTVFNTSQEVEDFISKRSSEGMDLTKPLWEICSGALKNEGFLLLRFHPCLLSGSNAVHLFCRYVADSSTDYSSPHRFPVDKTFHRALCSFLFFPVYFLNSWKPHRKHALQRKKFFSKYQEVNKTHRGVRKQACSGKIHLPSLMHCAAVMRSSLSAISLSVLVSSIRITPSRLGGCQALPVKLIYDTSNNVKSRELGLTAFGEVNIVAPGDIEGAIPCLWEIRQIVTSLKKSLFPYFSYQFLRWLKLFSPYKLPRRFLTSLSEDALCSFTSLSGPTATIYICGKRVQNVCFWFPASSDVMLSSSMFTYADEFRITVEVWEECGIDPKKIIAECERQLGNLIDLLKNRQIPRKRRKYYEDYDLDELDLNCEEDIEAPNSSNHSDIQSKKRSFFHRSKIHSSPNGGVGSSGISTVSQEVNVTTDDTCFNQSSYAPTESQLTFSGVSQPNVTSGERVAFQGILPKAPSFELDVGLEISPAIERRNSNSLL